MSKRKKSTAGRRIAGAVAVVGLWETIKWAVTARAETADALDDLEDALTEDDDEWADLEADDDDDDDDDEEEEEEEDW